MYFLEKLAQEALKNIPDSGEQAEVEPQQPTTNPLISKQMMAETLMDIIETMARRSVIH